MAQIREQAHAQRLTIRALAKASGIPVASVGAYMNGTKQPTDKALAAMAKGLHCTWTLRPGIILVRKHTSGE